MLGEKIARHQRAGVAGEHRVDGRAVRRRHADEDRAHARDDSRGARPARWTTWPTSAIRSSTSTCPTSCPGVPAEVLTPRQTWGEPAAYDAAGAPARADVRRELQGVRGDVDAGGRAAAGTAQPARGHRVQSVSHRCDYEARHRSGDSRAAPDRDQDLLRLQHRVRRAAEHARLPGVPRVSRRAAGAEPRGGRLRRSARRSRSAARSARRRSSRARTTSIRTCRRAIRSRSTNSRSRATARLEFAGTAGARSRRHHARAPGRGRRQVAARRASPTPIGRPTSTTTAAACRSSRSSPSPTCGPPGTPPSSSRGCARSWCGSASTTATWKRAASAATPTSRSGRPGPTRSGTKAEVKNLNSFRFLQKALEYEIDRQIEVVEDGGRVVQETRLWDAAAGATVAMRSKEEAHDYRYFPEPDLPPLVVDAARVDGIRAAMPELPDARRQRFVEAYGLPEYDAGQLTQSRAAAEFFEAPSRPGRRQGRQQLDDGGAGARAEGRRARTSPTSPDRPERLAGLIALIEKGTISGAMAKDVFEKMFASERHAERDRRGGRARCRSTTTAADSRAWSARSSIAIADAVAQYPRGQDGDVRLSRRAGDEGGRRQGEPEAGERTAEKRIGEHPQPVGADLQELSLTIPKGEFLFPLPKRRRRVDISGTVTARGVAV